MDQPAINESFKQSLRQRITNELLGNILPFWIQHTRDLENGGFYGALTNDLQIHNEAPRSAVVCARILWTYSAAYRVFQKADYLEMAQYAYRYLKNTFLDPVHGGVFWQVNHQGEPVMDRKHSYAQSFAIYGLAEYNQAVQDPESLRLAQELFSLLEAHAYDPEFGGYVEGRGRDWSALEDMRLSEKEPGCPKSMNTLLHMMEGYTNLLRVWPDEKLRRRLRELLGLFFEQVIDPQTHHFKLFFDPRWAACGGSRYDRFSFGHDIEGSWLLVEAAEVVGDAGLLAQARQAALTLAEVVHAQGLGLDGSVLHEGDRQGITNAEKHWWVQAEGMVGFYNAYQIGQDAKFALASRRCWDVMEAQFVDRLNGEWFKVLDPSGAPVPGQVKVGPWECPYHHTRACLEMIRRLSE